MNRERIQKNSMSFDNIGFNLINFKDKNQQLTRHAQTMLDRLSEMFEIKNLPETIPERIFKMMIMMQGFVIFYKVKENESKDYSGYRIFYSGLGGVPDIYYEPTIAVISNPQLKKSLNLKIDEECVIIRFDSMMQGVLPILEEYGSGLAENLLSMRNYSINSRLFNFLSTNKDRDKASNDKIVKDIENGELAVEVPTTFMENGIKLQPNASGVTGGMTQLIEFNQYLKASEMNEFGLNSNYNMKRESITANESNLNEDYLLSYPDNVKMNIESGLEKVNKMYGLDLKFEFKGAWKIRDEEMIQPINEEPSEKQVEEPKDEGVTEDVQD